MDRLDCEIRPYAWGSTTAIPTLQGRQPSGQPEAEMWIGAHSSAPSQVFRDDQWIALDKLIVNDPFGELGDATATTLPFLTKILAAQSPLSLQVHPTTTQAALGFAKEQAASLSDANERLYSDANHKPELICALTPFAALSGFRPIAATQNFLSALALPQLDWLSDRLAARPIEDELLTLLGSALRQDAVAAQETNTALVERLDEPVTGFQREAHWLQQVVAQYPDDPAVLVVLLLNLVELEPGEALFLDAGNLHSYLTGTGIEVMANSDNVIRGGLTTKKVDIPTLVDVVAAVADLPLVQRPDNAAHQWTYRSPVAEFTLTRVDLSIEPEFSVVGPATVLSIGGFVIDDAGVRLSSGQAGWVAAREGAVRLHGDGFIFVTTVGGSTEP
jgi:mannose-6-phosphate isomerase